MQATTEQESRLYVEIFPPRRKVCLREIAFEDLAGQLRDKWLQIERITRFGTGVCKIRECIGRVCVFDIVFYGEASRYLIELRHGGREISVLQRQKSCRVRNHV